MKLKSVLKVRLADVHFAGCLRIANATFVPEIRELVKEL